MKADVMTDAELIENHRRGSQEAFAELVRRHINWVYSVARRRVNDAHLAEDVTQAAFFTLAKKAPRLWSGSPLSPWLLKVVNLTCKAALRNESNRRRRETEAAKMRSLIENPEPAKWEQLSPQLDELVERLGRNDRTAVMLRFYEQKSFAEVGAAMGISEEAARKRVSRAVEKLRTTLNGKGMKISTTALGGLILSEAATPAPPALAATISITGMTPELTQGVLAIMLWMNIKLAAGLLATILVITSATVAVTQLSPQAAAPPPGAQPALGEALAKELLASYQKSLDAITRIHFIFYSENQYEGDWNFEAVPKFKRISRGEFFRDGIRSSTLHSSESLTAPNTPLSATNLYRVIIGPDGMAPTDYLSLDSYVGEEPSRRSLRFSSTRNANAPYTMAPGIELWGRIDPAGGTGTLPEELLSKASKLGAREKTEMIDGIETQVIDAITPSGKITVWLDPRAGYLPRRIEVQKTANDLHGRVVLGYPPPRPDPSSQYIYPLVAAKSFDYVAEKMQIVRIGDVFVPESFIAVSNRKHVDGQVCTLRTQFKRSDIDLNPDFAAKGAFRIDVPDGTQVNDLEHQDRTDPRYEWNQGRIVKIQRLYGRALREDGSPLYPLRWDFDMPKERRTRSSVNWLAEDMRPDGLFCVSLTSSERAELMEKAAGVLELSDRGGAIGKVNISELGTDPENPPKFAFPRK